MQVTSTNFSPVQNNHFSQEEGIHSQALVIHPNLGDRLVVTKRQFDSFLCDISSRIMGISLGEFLASPGNAKIQKMFVSLSSMYETLSSYDVMEDMAENMLQSIKVQVTQTIEEDMQGTLTVANVQTPSQLRSKQQRIAQANMTASQLFYSCAESSSLLADADGALTLSAFGELSSQHQQTIRSYWAFIARTKDGYQIHEQLVEKLLSPFDDIFDDLMEKATSCKSTKQTPVEQAQDLVQSTNRKIQRSRSLLLRERAQCHDDLSALKLDYLLLQQKLIGEAFAKHFITMHIEQLASVLECKVTNYEMEAKLLDVYISQEEYNLSFFKNWSPSPFACLDASQISAQKSADIALVEKKLQQLRDYKTRPGSFLISRYGNPAAVRALAPIMTSHEKAVIEAFIPQLQTLGKQNIICKELQLKDEQISVEYFLSKLRADAEQKKQVFSGLASKVTPL
jgi:hypothetical protein